MKYLLLSIITRILLNWIILFIMSFEIEANKNLLVSPDNAERSWTNRTFSRMEPGSLRGSIFNLLLTCIGTGFLAFPKLFYDGGLITTTAIMIVTVLLN